MSSEYDCFDNDDFVAYMKKKMPGWHIRLREGEQRDKQFGDKLDNIEKKVGEILDALKGSNDGTTRGVFQRLCVVEAWKKTVTWVVGVVFACLVAAIVQIKLTDGKAQIPEVVEETIEKK